MPRTFSTALALATAVISGCDRSTPSERAARTDTTARDTMHAGVPAPTTDTAVRDTAKPAAPTTSERSGAATPSTQTRRPTERATPDTGDPARGAVPETSAARTNDTAPAPAAAPSAAPAPAPRDTKPTPSTPPTPPPPSDTGAGQASADTGTAAPADTGTTAPLRDAYHPAARDTVDERTYQGWKYYNLNCARCHGEDVSGTTIAPHLVTSLKPGSTVPDERAFQLVVCAGRPEKGMPAWCPLGMTPAQIDTIYAYVKGRSDAKLHPGRPARRGS